MDKIEPNLKAHQLPKPIQEFLKKSEHKPKLYHKHINAINKLLKANREIDFNKILSIDGRKLSGNKKYDILTQVENIITNTIIYVTKENQSNNTIKAYKSSIKQLFEASHIELDATTWKKIKSLQNVDDKIDIDKVAPTTEEMKLILSNCDALEKAFFLLMSSSGLRKYDILFIELKDLHLENNPPEITNRTPCTATKKRLPFAYLTKEAKKAIEAYLHQRQRYLDTKNIKALKAKGITITNLENKLFPISERRIQDRWRRKCIKAGFYELNEKGKKKGKWELYILRSFFRTNLGNPDLAEFLMGHTHMRTLYYRQNLTKAKEDYSIYSNYLLINDEREIPDNIKKENITGWKDIKIDPLQKRIEKLEDTIKTLEYHNFPMYDKEQDDYVGHAIWEKTNDGKMQCKYIDPKTKILKNFNEPISIEDYEETNLQFIIEYKLAKKIYYEYYND